MANEIRAEPAIRIEPIAKSVNPNQAHDEGVSYMRVEDRRGDTVSELMADVEVVPVSGCGSSALPHSGEESPASASETSSTTLQASSTTQVSSVIQAKTSRTPQAKISSTSQARGTSQAKIGSTSQAKTSSTSQTSGTSQAKAGSMSQPSGAKTSTAAKTSSTSLSLQERRQQQLKLINEKLAKRHSTLERKETPAQSVMPSTWFGSPDPVSKDSKIASAKLHSTLERKETPPAHSTWFGSPDPVVEDSNVISASFVRKTALMQPALSREVPGKSVAYKPDATTDEAIEAFTKQDPLPTFLDPTEELLDSESSFLPVHLPLNDSTDQTIPEYPSLCDDSALSHTLGGQDTDLYVSSLLSSLNSAYGYSSLSEKSRLLSSLARTETLHFVGGTRATDPLLPDLHKEAVKIQAAFRGHLARRLYKTRVREVKGASLIQATW